ncbi:type VI secretion system Vgr family protein [Tamilnaduibacter salinus]|uniref:type VI secretion system Vgr family protein n=1 Tax=Tamilnaduibacter salinus TaxID=1484056 RepID=UPI001473AA42|nr:type VI secretion system tip protein VgrG [Tamilnaduibacter salinus]
MGQLPDDHFAVVGFSVHEGLSELFEGVVELASTDAAVAAGDVLEQPIELCVYQDGACQRRMVGVVAEFARGESGHRRTRYEVLMRPALWRLGLMHNSRIFQQQTPQTILQTLLDERGVVDTAFNLKQTPVEREYSVQHRESDLAFIKRLCAEQGWHWRFDGESSRQPLVIADHHNDAPRLDPVEHNARAGGQSRQPVVFEFAYRERVGVASVALKDYTFKNPAYALLHEHEGTHLDHQRTDYQHYDYPGRFKDDDQGSAFTQSRLEALRNDTRQAKGASNRADFTAGAKVDLTDHPDETLNRDWLLVHVTHTGQQPQALEEEGGDQPTTYHNAFTAVPGDTPWRPTPPHRPLMDGPQMAIVTGPKGEEIHCDEHGRVKVRFPWDRYSQNDEHSSAWLRVSQGWAGGQYGFFTLPRIGNEVIVSFLDGDPDQPIITGRTHHATNTPPETLPKHKTRTTLKTQTHKGEGHNELRFEDEADQQQIYLHAQKDLDLLTENDRTEVIKNNQHLTVHKDRVDHIQGNDDRTVDGESRVAIGGDASQTIGGSIHQKTGTATLSEAGTEVHHKAGQKVVLDAGTELTIAAGGSFLKLDASGVTMMGPQIKLNSGGAPGSGSGTSPKSPGTPGAVTAQGGKVAPEALAEVSERATHEVSPSAPETLIRAAKNDQLFSGQCHQKPDGSCPLADCPCVSSETSS